MHFSVRLLAILVSVCLQMPVLALFRVLFHHNMIICEKRMLICYFPLFIENIFRHKDLTLKNDGYRIQVKGHIRYTDMSKLFKQYIIEKKCYSDYRRIMNVDFVSSDVYILLTQSYKRYPDCRRHYRNHSTSLNLNCYFCNQPYIVI